MGLIVNMIAYFLSIDLDAPITNNIILWGMVFGVSFLVVIFVLLGIFLVTGTFGFFMCLTGKFNKEEAIGYAFYSRYPDRWFKEKP